jgi:hypothetical protein
MVPPKVTVNGTELQTVEHFCYLGSMISANGSAATDIDCRIGKAYTSFNLLKNCFFSRNDISIGLKMRVYIAAVRSVLLYGCETWPMTQQQADKLNVFEMMCMRQCLNLHLTDRIPNTDIRERCGQSGDVMAIVKRRRLTWLGHILRMGNERIPHQLLFSEPPANWKRPRGGIRQTWRRSIHADTKILTNNIRHSIGSARDWQVDKTLWMNYLSDLAESRTQWRQIVVGLI